MDWSIAKILMQDGLVTGVIYALLAVSLVLVFAVTRIILIVQGEFVTYGALTFAVLADDQIPGTRWLLVIAGLLVFVRELWLVYRGKPAVTLVRSALFCLVLPVAVFLAVPAILGTAPSLWAKALMTLFLVVPLGPMLYKLAYESMADSSVLALFVISIAVHFAFVGMGLAFFGAEGRLVAQPFFDGQLDLFGLTWTYQSLFVIAMTAVIIAALWLFFGYTLYGKALRATAVNRRGARLVGISTDMSGFLTFLLSSIVGVLSGIMIVSFISITYETGFMIGLKGFVGAIIGGLMSYPIAAVGALVVGIIESFSTFWASEYKEVIVFALIIPVLLILSVTSRHDEEE